MFDQPVGQLKRGTQNVYDFMINAVLFAEKISMAKRVSVILGLPLFRRGVRFLK